jgi:hypothetical protein
LGRIRQERRHLGAHHVSTGICYHGKIELSYISARYSTKVQPLQLVSNTQVRAEPVIHSVYIVL